MTAEEDAFWASIERDLKTNSTKKMLYCENCSNNISSGEKYWTTDIGIILCEDCSDGVA